MYCQLFYAMTKYLRKATMHRSKLKIATKNNKVIKVVANIKPNETIA